MTRDRACGCVGCWRGRARGRNYNDIWVVRFSPSTERRKAPPPPPLEQHPYDLLALRIACPCSRYSYHVPTIAAVDLTVLSLPHCHNLARGDDKAQRVHRKHIGRKTNLLPTKQTQTQPGSQDVSQLQTYGIVQPQQFVYWYLAG